MQVFVNALRRETEESIAQTRRGGTVIYLKRGDPRLGFEGVSQECFLKHDLCAVLQLSGIESAHGASSLRKGIIGFADVNPIEKIEHVQAQLKPTPFCQDDASRQPEVNRRKTTCPVDVSSQITNRTERRLNQPDLSVWRSERSRRAELDDAGSCS